MKILGILLLIGAILLAGCSLASQEAPKCSPPYIIVGDDCCLDENADDICDSDQAAAAAPEEIAPEPEEEAILQPEAQVPLAEIAPGTVTAPVNKGTVPEIVKGCGDNVCGESESCSTCQIDCGCGTGAVCLTTGIPKKEYSCVPYVLSSKHIETRLTDMAGLGIGTSSASRSGAPVSFKYFAINKEPEFYQCTYWVLREGKQAVKKTLSLSGYTSQYMTFSESGSEFIFDDKENKVKLLFAVNCVSKAAGVNETQYAAHTVTFNG
ncbi:MAG TPA: hypothetical protein VJI75_03825 [Candidatus Nanoarchaeia archaeon]|nr:hypothetical protein [Candidatus Nanoarchaeia archaeon]